uniref:hypothetical protein n=1 Tax=Flavobacterium macrobrachii TaxID=591204 RepID=UPI001656FE7A
STTTKNNPNHLGAKLPSVPANHIPAIRYNLYEDFHYYRGYSINHFSVRKHFNSTTNKITYYSKKSTYVTKHIYMRYKENLHALQRKSTYVTKNIYMRYKENLHTLQSTFTYDAKNIYMRYKAHLHTLQRTFTCVAIHFDNLTKHFDNVTIHFDNLTFNIYMRCKAF